MAEWIVYNLGTIIVCLILIAIVAAIIYSMIKDKRSGKSSCGGSCSSCPMGSACRSSSDKSEKGSLYDINRVHIRLKIDGMMCKMCEAHINDLIRQNFRVKKVVSSYKDGETVIVSDEAINKEELEKALSAIGYRVISYECA